MPGDERRGRPDERALAAPVSTVTRADGPDEGATGERIALICFLAGSVLAGGNAVAVRFSNRELAPLWGAGLRFALGFVLLAIVMMVMRLSLPRGRALTGAILYGTLIFFGAFAFAYYALLRLQAGFAQTLLALVPLATLLLAVAQRQERLRFAGVVGTVVSLVGVGVLSRAPLPEAVPPLTLLAVLGGILCFAEAGVLVRRLPPIHPIVINAVGMAAGATLLLAGSLVAGEAHVVPRRATTWLALGYVVPVGSVVVFVLGVVVLRYWTASRAAYQFVLMPVTTVLLSAWLDDERITLWLVAGGVLVLAGVYIGALRPAAQTAEIASAPSEDEVHA